MKRLRQWWRLPAREQQLLVRAAVLLALLKVALRFLPFAKVQRLVALTRVAARARPRRRGEIERIVWAVSTAGYHVPRSTCLTTALAAQVLLERHGIPACLRIGVTRPESGPFLAHAWVESAGQIVIGKVENPADYAALRPLALGLG